MWWMVTPQTQRVRVASTSRTRTVPGMASDAGLRVNPPRLLRATRRADVLTCVHPPPTVQLPYTALRAGAAARGGRRLRGVAAPNSARTVGNCPYGAANVISVKVVCCLRILHG